MNIQKQLDDAEAKWRMLVQIGKRAMEKEKVGLANFLYDVAADYVKVAERCNKILERRAK